MKIIYEKINKKFRLKDVEYLSKHEISDIVGNYSKEDFYVEKKKYTNFNNLNFFSLLQIEI